MSTRRARIKAVAALPPRRKNQENGDVKSRSKESIEKALKSPKSPRGFVNKSEEKNSPSRSIRSPPALIPINKTPIPDRVPSPANLSSPTASEKDSAPITATVPVIIAQTSGENVFVSPRARDSPERRRTASPFVITSPKPTDKAEIFQNLVTNLVSDIHASCNKSYSTEVDGSVPQTDTTAANFIENTEGTPGILSKHQEKNKSEATSSREEHNDIPDDHHISSAPQTVLVERGIDGIVPLQTATHVPKPTIPQSKNDSISHYAEGLFDPIVSLPSPSKVRPKLRPVPRLAPHRRNSIQGSASESEDESRRALLSGGASAQAPRQRHDSHSSYTTVQSALNREVNRTRNDSISSSVSQVPTHPPPALSPVKEKHFSNKIRRQEMSRRSWCRRKEVKRDALTMYDLIFYNPTTNPIVPDEDEMIAKEANAKEEAERNAKGQESEEDADDPLPSDAAPVPQIKLGPNGEIILDEQSLVIKQSDSNRKVSSVVREGSWAGSGGGRYSRAARTAEWSAAETVRFYRALGAVGTDFTLMVQLFPGRKRKDLYLKFKKEERLNGAQVDKALRSATSWDATALLDEFKHERAQDAKKADEERQKLMRQKEEERERLRIVKRRIRNSKGARALAVLGNGGNHPEMTADDFIRRSLEARNNNKRGRKRKKDDEFIPPTRKNTRRTTPTPKAQEYATLTLLNGNTSSQQQTKPSNDLATISRLESNAQPMQISLNEVSGVPSNIETGSLVVLRVNDPSSPSKTMLQTYIAHGSGKLTPVSLPPTFLNSVVGYMKQGAPKSASTASSPRLTSPGSVASHDSRSCTPTVIQVNPSLGKRTRHSSYTITQL